jgi:hypothetical protein
LQKTEGLIAATTLIQVAVALSVTTSGLLAAQKAVPASGVISSKA